MPREGRPRREIVEIARRNGMRVIGPNCLGVVSTAPGVRMNARSCRRRPRGQRRVPLAVGWARHPAMSQASSLGVGISDFLSVGNKADVSGNDLLQYWADDPHTDVILLYLESFGNPRQVPRLAGRMARTKPIVAVKGGRSNAGRRAASSHTAASRPPTSPSTRCSARPV